ncbi:hypothetical protein [Belnapia rosea]|uniref:hypothetical protein n=1 Tax=Belnapia rosea TaxID=938405 RepID=UPI00088B0021|nr:hypothetical protein [Belnapia rosea]SDB75038.1 hypothetical protein SAMN02927895_05743 [Belnapia rosea]
MPATNPNLSLIQTTGGSELVETPTGWKADLGTVQAGAILRTISFGLLNNGDADTLVANFATEKDDAAVRVFGTESAFEMQPSSGQGAIAITMDTARAGQHLESLVIHSKNIAADGTETALPDAVVSVSYNVAGASLPGPLSAGAYSSTAPSNEINTSSVHLDGLNWSRAQYIGSWSSSGSIDLHPSKAEVTSLGGNFLISTFQQVHADLASSGSAVHAVYVIGGENGSVIVGDGAQSVLWSFAHAPLAPNVTGTIATGAGNDTITVTAIGIDGHTDLLNQASILPYSIYPSDSPRGPSTYNGSASKAMVDAGSGNDHLILKAPVATTIRLDAGDGHDTVDGYLKGTDHLELHGVAASSIKVSQTNGDTLISYGSGSILLHGVTGFDAHSISVLDAPTAPLPPTDTYHYPAANDWNAIGRLVTAFHEANGWWATLQQIEEQHWAPPGSAPPCDPVSAPLPVVEAPHVIDWNALAAQATENFQTTGQWLL